MKTERSDAAACAPSEQPWSLVTTITDENRVKRKEENLTTGLSRLCRGKRRMLNQARFHVFTTVGGPVWAGPS